MTVEAQDARELARITRSIDRIGEDLKRKLRGMTTEDLYSLFKLLCRDKKFDSAKVVMDVLKLRD